MCDLGVTSNPCMYYSIVRILPPLDPPAKLMFLQQPVTSSRFPPGRQIRLRPESRLLTSWRSMALLHLQIDLPPPPPVSGGSSKARGRLGTSRCGSVTARVLHQVSPAHSVHEHGSRRRPRPIIRGGNFSGYTASLGLDACRFHDKWGFWLLRLFKFSSENPRP